MNTEQRENKADKRRSRKLEQPALENPAVQEFVQGSGDAWEAQTGGLEIPSDTPPIPADPGNYVLVNGEWVSDDPFDSYVEYTADIISELANNSEKVRARRDKWKDRYSSVKAQLIQERKRNCMVSGILIDLILKGDLNVVASARNR